MGVQLSRGEIAAMMKLAAPVVLAEIGWVFMSIVDTLMVGRLGPESIGAVSLGSSLFLAVAVFGIGLLLGLDTFVSQAYGAQKFEECRVWLTQGVYLSLFITLPSTFLMLLPVAFLDWLGTPTSVRELTVPYLQILTLSVLPLFLYSSFRRYLQAQSRVRCVMYALISANVINALANWILIFGNLGAPRLGVTGAGWATFASRVYLALFLFCYVSFLEKRKPGTFRAQRLRLQWDRILRLVKLGLPAAIQLTLEVGVFALATVLASRLAPIALAAHQIALSIASFTFMVPLGVSAAGAVRVGQAMGRRDPQGAERAGWTAILIGAGFMSLAALVLIAFPGPVLRLYTDDRELIQLGFSLLAVAAVFQIFDGLQVVSTGILRGLGLTHVPMLANLLAHWFFGLPVSYLFCFWMGWGVTGLWMGLCLGLILVAIALVIYWSLAIRMVQR